MPASAADWGFWRLRARGLRLREPTPTGLQGHTSRLPALWELSVWLQQACTPQGNLLSLCQNTDCRLVPSRLA